MNLIEDDLVIVGQPVAVFERLQYVLDFVVQVLGGAQTFAQVTHEIGLVVGLLQTILYVHVDHVTNRELLRRLVLHEVDQPVEHLPLARHDHVELLAGVLKPFRLWFQLSVAVQHLQQAYLGVDAFVLLLQLLEDFVVGDAEVVDVGGVRLVARYAYLVGDAVASHVQVRYVEQHVVYGHAAVHVAGAHHRHSQATLVGHLVFGIFVTGSFFC